MKINALSKIDTFFNKCHLGWWI